MQRTKKGFTLIELLVVIAIIALLVSILMPSLGRARELAKQAACMSNLNSIGKGLALYMGANSDQFPVVADGGDANAAFDTAAVDSFAKMFDGTMSTHGMNNMWLMIREGEVSRNAFHCPSDTNWSDNGNDTGEFGWEDWKEVSYGISYPYDYQEAALTNENPAALADWDNLTGEFAVMADRNPGGEVGSTNVSSPSNHTDDGESVLYQSFSVAFYKDLADSKAGAAGDGIYTNTTSGVAGGIPEAADDTSICTDGQ